MIKVPGTPEGLPAIRQLISEGINVNVTLLFAQEVYEQVAEAYIAGLEDLAAKQGDLSGVASVASFFISRIDTLVDSIVTEKMKAHKGSRPAGAAEEHPWESSNREWKAYLPALPGDLQRAALGGARQKRCANAARTVGQHQHQEPQLP